MSVLKSKVAIRLALAAGLVVAGLPALAQQWPTRTVRLIVPFAPGAGADIGARLAADKLQKFWTQGVIVENRPGGDSLIAIRQVVSAADDHMLLFSPSGNFTPHPYRHEKRGYDRATDLLPIARFSNTLLGLAVSKSLGVTTLKQFVDKAKAAPGKMNVVLVPGITEFVWDGFAKTVGIEVTKVPYTNLVQGANDMGTERVQATLASLAILQPSMQGGVAQLLIQTGRERVKLLADTPTANEAGFPSLELEGLVGAFGPKGMSPDLRGRIAKDIVSVASEPDIMEKLVATGQVPNPGGTEEFTAAIERQEAQVANIAKLLGLPRKD